MCSASSNIWAMFESSIGPCELLVDLSSVLECLFSWPTIQAARWISRIAIQKINGKRNKHFTREKKVVYLMHPINESLCKAKYMYQWYLYICMPTWRSNCMEESRVSADCGMSQKRTYVRWCTASVSSNLAWTAQVKKTTVAQRNRGILYVQLYEWLLVSCVLRQRPRHKNPSTQECVTKTHV